MFSADIDLSLAISFITRLSVVALFSAMLIGFVIKKMIQLMIG